MLDPKTATLEEAKIWLRERFGDGAQCPCCNQLVKRYKRKLNSFMALSLIKFYHYSVARPEVEWLHIKDLVEIAAGGGEFPRLRYWGLIEEQPGERPDGGKHRGFWRITENGKSFVRGTLEVPKYIYLYNQEIVSSQGDDPGKTTVREALGSKFNYSELMAR